MYTYVQYLKSRLLFPSQLYCPGFRRDLAYVPELGIQHLPQTALYQVRDRILYNWPLYIFKDKDTVQLLIIFREKDTVKQVLVFREKDTMQLVIVSLCSERSILYN
jgi:hypothetical protein